MYPLEIDLRQWENLVPSQGITSTCTSFEFQSMCEMIMLRAGIVWKGSELFLNWTSGQYGHWGSLDDGRKADWVAGAASIGSYGMRAESAWPFDQDQVRTMPSEAAFASPAIYVEHWEDCGANTDQAILNIHKMLTQGFSCIISGAVYTKLSSLIPGDFYQGSLDVTDSLQGGHTLKVVGISMLRQAFLCKNSWTAQWDGDGYFWLLFDVFKKDFFQSLCVTKLVGIINPPPLYEITPMDKIQVYLPASRSFTVIETDVNVYGGSLPGSVVITDTADNVMLDQNVGSVRITKLATGLKAMQAGNEVLIYFNGTLLLTWPVPPAGGTVTTLERILPVVLGNDGIMRLNDQPLSSIAPMPIV